MEILKRAKQSLVVQAFKKFYRKGYHSILVTGALLSLSLPPIFFGGIYISWWWWLSSFLGYIVMTAIWIFLVKKKFLAILIAFLLSLGWGLPFFLGAIAQVFGAVLFLIAAFCSIMPIVMYKMPQK